MNKRSTCESLISSLVLFMQISIIALGCRNDKNHIEHSEINIEGNVNNFKPISVCDLNCEIRYIPLETDPVFLGSASLYVLSEEYILVSDRASCLLYGVDGNFISQIGSKGRGPGQYNYITKIQLGRDHKIYIQDLSVFLVFDPSGKFQYRFKPEINPDDIGSGNIVGNFFPCDDSVFIGQIRNDSGLAKFKAVFFDKTGRTIKLVDNFNKINMIKPYSSSRNGNANIYRNGQGLFIKERFDDTVFRINNQYQFEPAYHVNLGRFGMPKEVRELRYSELQKKGADYIGVEYFFETSKYCFLACSFGNHGQVKPNEKLNIEGTRLYWSWLTLGVFEKGKNEMVFAKVNTKGTFLTISGLANDYDGGISFFPDNQVNESTLSMWVDVNWLKEHVASDYFKKSKPKYPEKKKELEELTNRLSDNDNPVLILCTFKN